MKTDLYNLYSSAQDIEAFDILKKRLELNNINFSIIKKKKVLNIGDNSGRYSKALKKLGASEVTTFNETGIVKGSQVEHKLFGKGEVVNIEGIGESSKLTILFANNIGYATPIAYYYLIKDELFNPIWDSCRDLVGGMSMDEFSAHMVPKTGVGAIMI